MVTCIQTLDKNLYKEKSLTELNKLFKRVNKLRWNMEEEMSYRRVYIPKASSGSFAESDRHTYRPLGVPSLPWRIFLNMLSHPLVLAAPVRGFQHGFKPNRGTLTAWAEMFQKVIPSPNIYEIDLKQCFPSISLPRLMELLLLKYNLPEIWARYYVHLNYSIPEFKGAILANDIQYLLLKGYLEHLKKANKPRAKDGEILEQIQKELAEQGLQVKDLKVVKKSRTWGMDQDMLVNPVPYTKVDLPRLIEERSASHLGLLPEILKSFIGSTLPKVRVSRGLELDKAYRDWSKFRILNIEEDLLQLLGQPEPPKTSELHNEATVLKQIGTIQGSPLSPYLSSIALQEIGENLPPGVEVLMYADDMIFYGPNLAKWLDNGPETLAIYLESLGFTMHGEKSGWLVKNGKVEKAVIKFLGCEYNFETKIWKSKTRKGNELVMNKEDLLSAEYDIKEMIGNNSKETIEEGKSRVHDKFMHYYKKKPKDQQVGQ